MDSVPTAANVTTDSLSPTDLPIAAEKLTGIGITQTKQNKQGRTNNMAKQETTLTTALAAAQRRHGISDNPKLVKLSGEYRKVVENELLLERFGQASNLPASAVKEVQHHLLFDSKVQCCPRSRSLLGVRIRSVSTPSPRPPTGQATAAF